MQYIEIDVSNYTIPEIEKYAFELCRKLPLKTEGLKRYKLEEIDENGRKKERVSLLFSITY